MEIEEIKIEEAQEVDNYSYELLQRAQNRVENSPLNQILNKLNQKT